MNLYQPIISGSLEVSGSVTINGTLRVLSGSVLGTASIAENALLLNNLDSGSFVGTGSFANLSSSFATTSGSVSSRLVTQEAASASFAAQSASLSTRLTTDESNYTSLSSSFATTSGSISGRVAIIEGQDATTGSNNFTAPQQISDVSNAISFTSTASLYTDGGLRVAKDSYVSGTAYFNNVVVYGTSSIEYITSSQVDIGANIITVNTDTPAVRFGGLAVYDSGSTQLTGSMLWDSEKNHWVYSNPSGSTYSGGMLISGPRSSALGDEVGTTSCALMMGQGGDHITSSAIFSYGNATCFYGNAYISSSGDVCFTKSVCAYSVNVANGGGVSSIFRQTDANSYSSLRLYNDLNSANRALEIDYFGSTYPSGERAEIFNTGAYPLLLGTSNTARLAIAATGIACFTCQVCAPYFVGSNGVLSCANITANGGTITSTTSTTGNPAVFIANAPDNTSDIGFRVQTGGALKWFIGMPNNTVSDNFSIFDGNCSTDRLTIDTSGNVGINTSSPGSLLSIQRGASGDNLELVGSGASGYSDILFYNTSKATRLGYIDWSNTQARWNVEANIPFRIYTNSTERITILGGGNVGIGATDPKAKLHTCTGYSSTNLQAIFGNSNGSINCINYDTVVIQQDDVTTLKLVERNVGSIDQVLGISIGDGFARFSTTCTQPMQFFVNGNPSACSYNGLSGTLALEIATSGISTFSYGLCANRLTLAGALNMCGTWENTGTGTGVYTRTTWYVDTNNQILFENGRQTDSAAGTGRTVYFTWRGGPSVGGGVQLQHGTNAWAAYTSDCRMKTKVANVENGLAAVMKLNPIKFKWTSELETSKTVTGFTAQNVEEAIPDAVFNSWTHCELGEIKSYYQDYLVPYLVKAVQEQQCTINLLKSCIGIS